MLATEYPPSPPDGSSPDKPVRVVAVDLATHQFTTVYTAPDAHTIPYGVQGDDRWIVWALTYSGYNIGSDWEIQIYNRADGSRKMLAKAAHDKSGKLVTASDGEPLLDRGRLVWADDIGDSSATRDTAIKMLDLASGQVTLLSATGGMPRLSWPYVAWLQRVAADPAPNHLVIVVHNLETGSTHQLLKPYAPVEFALAGDWVAWIGLTGDRITLTNVDETVEQVLPVGGGVSRFERIALNDRLVRWDGGDGAKIWDRRQSRQVTLPSPGGGLGFLSGPYMLWQSDGSPASPGVIHILDTTQLP